jgi:hypothetical protein
MDYHDAIWFVFRVNIAKAKSTPASVAMIIFLSDV